MNVNLENLTPAELVNLKSDIEKEIENRKNGIYTILVKKVLLAIDDIIDYYEFKNKLAIEFVEGAPTQDGDGWTDIEIKMNWIDLKKEILDTFKYYRPNSMTGN